MCNPYSVRNTTQHDANAECSKNGVRRLEEAAVFQTSQQSNAEHSIRFIEFLDLSLLNLIHLFRFFFISSLADQVLIGVCEGREGEHLFPLET